MSAKTSLPEARPTPAIWLLHIFALCGFTVAQPLYDVLGRFGPFLVAHSSEAVDVLALAGLLSLGLPLLLALPSVALARLSPRTGWRLHVSVVGLLCALLALQAVRRGTSSTAAVLATALLLGALAAWAYLRFAVVRRGLSWLAAAAAVFPLLFLLASPVRSLLMPGVGDEAAVLSRPATTPVLLLVLDEFPLFSLLDADEELDAGRFPNIAALAAEAMWYRNATTVAQSTAYGVPAILSGRYPFKEVLLPVAKDYRRNLFTLLAGSYNLNAFETGTRLCPIDLCAGNIVRPELVERMKRLLVDLSAVYLHLVAPADMAQRLPDIGGGWQGYWQEKEPPKRSKKKAFAEARNVRKYRWDHPRETFDQFLESIGRYPRPTLHYLHVLLPHAPWTNLPDGKRFYVEKPPGLEDRYWTGTEWQIAQNLQRHVLQVGFVDRALGELRDLLEEAGLYDESLIVLVSDHGSGFRQGEGRRWLTPGPGKNLTDIANIPLIVKFPGGQPRGIDDRNVETIDILPTILDVLGIDTEGLSLDGRSLAAHSGDARELKIIYPTRGNRSERGTPIEFRVEDLRGRLAAVRFKLEYLGSGDWESVFAMGRYGSLVGAELDDPALQPTPEPLVLHRARRYERVDLSEEYLPLWISGSLGGSSGVERWVAVALNGRVAAVTQTYPRDEEERFATLVAPASLRHGKNEIEVRALRPARPGAMEGGKQNP